MSRNTLTLSKDGKALQVVAGWDRPLQQFFMSVVPQADLEDDDTSLDALFDAEHRSFQSGTHIAATLAEHGLVLPHAMIRAIDEDAVFNAGNVMREFSEQGNVLKSFGT